MNFISFKSIPYSLDLSNYAKKSLNVLTLYALMNSSFLFDAAGVGRV